MKIGPTVKEISYSMLRTTKQYENDRADFTVVVGGKGTQADVDEAVAEAKQQCARALKAADPTKPALARVVAQVIRSGPGGILASELVDASGDIRDALNQAIALGLITHRGVRYYSAVI